MADALIGYTGFVGDTLLRQRHFEALYRSTTINEIEGKSFGCVVCAGASAKKWMANRNPVDDRQKIEDLIGHLKTIQCDNFILISTVDVFKSPIAVDENTAVDETGLHAYGLHRRILEKFVESHFPSHLIVRLPGLVGFGLRKNVIFDLLNDNNLDSIDSRGVFQFYPMANLWHDIESALHAGLKIVHLTAEPISVAEVANEGFGKRFIRELPGVAATYDLRSVHARLFGGSGFYQYNKRESILAIRNYAQSEPVTIHHGQTQTS